MSKYDARYPSLPYLRARAKRRLPHFIWEFLESGTGSETVLKRNRDRLDAITFLPSVLHGEVTPGTTSTFLDVAYDLPVGISTVGMSGAIWPDAERTLARAAAELNIPYTLSTVASRTPEEVSDALGPNAWFQLYPPRDPEIRRDMLRRAKAAGFNTLVLTVDIPVPSRRERQVRSGLTQPPKLTPRILAQLATRPAWALGMARMGMPRMKLIDEYAPKPTKGRAPNDHAGYHMRTAPDWDYLRALREEWKGPLIVKGVMDASDAPKLEQEGIDAIWVSNHGGRQFDGAPASIDVLAGIRAATDLPLVFDSGVDSGLDVLRAIAMGADFVMLGRGWHFALAALGSDGPMHLAHVLKSDLIANMGQMGLRTPTEIRGKMWS